MTQESSVRTRPSVGLVLIVRNEALTVPRLAASLAGCIDYYTVVDTGSTDKTEQAVAEAFRGVPGQFLAHEWDSFGESRNFALQAAMPKTDWLLLMDADETLVGALDASALGPGLDGVMLAVRNDENLLWLPRLVRSDHAWHWVGRTHEYLGFSRGEPCLARWGRGYVLHHADGGSRQDKYERDLAWLGVDWDNRPGDPRTAFYLARTYEGLDRPVEAAEWYRRRQGLGGGEEERWYARYRLGVCLLGSGVVAEGRRQLWAAADDRPARAEPLMALAEDYRVWCSWDEAWRAIGRAFLTTAARPDGRGAVTNDSLFLESDTYRWRVAYEASIVAWHLGNTELGLRYCDYVLSCPVLAPGVRRAVAANKSVYLYGRPA